jgi:hypothetical protein
MFWLMKVVTLELFSCRFFILFTVGDLFLQTAVVRDDHEQQQLLLTDRHHGIVHHFLWMPLAQFCLIPGSPSALK